MREGECLTDRASECSSAGGREGARARGGEGTRARGRKCECVSEYSTGMWVVTSLSLPSRNIIDQSGDLICGLFILNK